MYVLYTMLLVLSGLGFLPYLCWRCLRGAGYHRDLLERFGYGTALRLASQQAQDCLWFHAASVGEVQSLQPIVACLRQRFPAWPVVFSTFTPSGKRLARRLLPEAASVFLLPVDLPWIMRRVVRRLRPRAVIVQETELWPQFFRAVARRQAPVVIVNGRLSARSVRRYLRLRVFMQRLFTDVALLLVQTHDMAQRFQRLGVAPHRIKVVGNTNIDRALLAAPHTPLHVLTPLVQGRRVLVAGSTHEGEETVLLEVYRRLRPQHPDLLLLLAPRHMERVETVVRHVRAAHCRALRRSLCDELDAAALDGDVVVILDTLGELGALYQLCTVAFVGGSLVPIGGHNILEPAVFAKPLLFGPYMDHFPELARMICQAGGAIQVQHAADLYTQVARLLQQPEAASVMGQRALQVLQANHGALARTCDLVSTLLQQQADASAA
jgi:3-deoxy-D-manno-octulosonic-acid transferase